MAVKIRLKETGKSNARGYRIVAIDESKKRDGKVIETLGYTSPQDPDKALAVRQDRLDFWIKTGATLTAAAAKLLGHS